MARFFKHIGETNGKKVVIVQRTIPGEEHMCSVLYSDIIPSQYHDDIMRVLESEEGQDANEFADVLRRRIGTNGNNLLDAVAREGYLKKAQTNFVIVKPNQSSSIRLDELNKLLAEAGQGEAAVQKLEELDRQQGFKDSRKQNPNSNEATQATSQGTDGALDDSALAQINMQQAEQMKAEAKRLTDEAKNLEQEAFKLDPALKPKRAKTSGTRSKKTTA